MLNPPRLLFDHVASGMLLCLDAWLKNILYMYITMVKSLKTLFRDGVYQFKSVVYNVSKHSAGVFFQHLDNDSK